MINRFKLYRAFILCVVIVVPLKAVQDNAHPLDPVLSCHVLTQAGTNFPEGQTISVSNLKRIPLIVTLSDARLPFARVRPARTDGKEERLEAAVEILVNRIDQDKKISVPIKLILSGIGLNGNSQYLHLFLEIPIDSAKRKQNIESFINKAKSDPQATKQQLKLLDLYKNSAAAALENLYMENSVGEYELSCTYSLAQRAGAFREVRSNSIRLRVVFEGQFFDKPNYR